MEEIVRNTLLDVYSKLGDMEEAWHCFEEMGKLGDDVSFNSLIAGYARLGKGELSLVLYVQFLRTGLRISQFTFAGVLSACAGISGLVEGKQIHALVFKTGFEGNVFVANAVMDMYAKSGELESSWRVFVGMHHRDNISWNGLISGYSREGLSEEAMNLFIEMLKYGVAPTHFTFSSILSSCASIGSLLLGMQVHCKTIHCGLESDVFVSNAIIDMYAKCGSLESAMFVFNERSNLNTISWTALIAGYAQNGFNEEAIKLFTHMLKSDFKPDNGTFASVLSSCASLTALNYGKQVQVHAIKLGFDSNIYTASSLVSMYAKCGDMKEASKRFSAMPIRNLVTWNAIIAGHAHNGEGEKVLELFRTMVEQDGIAPDHVTYVNVLHACSYAGMVEEGYWHFRSMSEDFGISPYPDHYACMVDLLGRCGRLDEAEEFVESMPIEPDGVIWGALLGACRTHRHVELAERAAERLFAIEPMNSVGYVLLANIYSACGLWEGVARVRKMMHERGVKKVTACSWVEAQMGVHVFVSNDRVHPRLREIHEKLEELGEEMRRFGHVPDKSFVLQQLEEEQKVPALSYHSEKLAVAFGLISIDAPAPIRVMQNLRVCGDCHSAMKLITRIEGREIILGNSTRFHHFNDGICSCGDYW
ncbi:putative pentatricopeptide repeat-containing protein At2g01510 [Amborella trichopoda]|nr:putative pentatricopeptide repeat-containing protein At2g01510 [Amborella trichopoda]|eukprot:XP_006843075.3 putative pentatricopeptide repeat-containing protein At2g01510 [Amborella trichopoda]